MDMQNVSNLQIPEGEVKTIHDEDGRLLWGAVGYNTTYRGNTFQQTYSGANLYNVNDPYSAYSVVVDNEGWITLSSNNTGSSNVFVQYYSKKMNVAPDTDYAVVVELKSVKSNNLDNNNNYLNVTDSSNTQFSSAAYRLPFTSTNPTQPGTHVSILHTKADVNTSYGFRTFLTVAPGVDQEVTFRISVLADTSVTPETFVYQPYTGGIPAPSPDYPQTVQVATGEQTVTISNGADSQNFVVDLGSLELCKIGDYQDYIYKSGDNWYVHKACGKYVFDGTEAWASGAYGTNSWTLDNVIITSFDTTKTQVISNLFRGVPHDDRSIAGDNIIYFGSNIRLWIRNTSLAALANVQSTTNGNYAYYVLATPTNTQIIDVTLVGQLDDVHEWLTRYGYNTTITGNLPIIIDKTSL